MIYGKEDMEQKHGFYSGDKVYYYTERRMAGRDLGRMITAES